MPAASFLRVTLLGATFVVACRPLSSGSCPASLPQEGSACALDDGTQCTYDAASSRCGAITCLQGTWQRPIAMPNGCPAPDGGVPARDPANPFTTCTAFRTEFGPFDKSCAAAGDCAFGYHEMSCCGDRAAIGFNARERDRFAAEEAVCERGFPGCGCASNTLLVEQPSGDGGSGDPVSVDCVAGRCLTRW